MGREIVQFFFRLNLYTTSGDLMVDLIETYSEFFV